MPLHPTRAHPPKLGWLVRWLPCCDRCAGPEGDIKKVRPGMDEDRRFSRFCAGKIEPKRLTGNANRPLARVMIAPSEAIRPDIDSSVPTA